VPLVEVSEEAEEEWSMEVLKGVTWYATVVGCTPGYINAEGQSFGDGSPAEAAKAARSVGWSEGMGSYEKVIEAWRKNGALKGLEITAA
jgi:hypothetical protein